MTMNRTRTGQNLKDRTGPQGQDHKDRTPRTGIGQEQDRILKDRILRTGHAQTNTPEKSFYPKLPNARTTIPRNTAASKTAVGPLNTSKDEIITVLTPQAELTAANTEIK